MNADKTLMYWLSRVQKKEVWVQPLAAGPFISYMDTGSKELLSMNDTFEGVAWFGLFVGDEDQAKSEVQNGEAGHRSGEGKRWLISFDEVQGTSTTLMVLV